MSSTIFSTRKLDHRHDLDSGSQGDKYEVWDLNIVFLIVCQLATDLDTTGFYSPCCLDQSPINGNPDLISTEVAPHKWSWLCLTREAVEMKSKH